MDPKHTDVSVRYVTFFAFAPSDNWFQNIPSDLNEFLDKEDGIMQGIVDRLEPNQLYEIKISIKSITDK